ncbi:unnamed protein product [Cylicostephanus goldi]|uniref:Uncharacterized protein n=1 Tax=Cylicostephanus goldi TaxID=71465 RepID=A0A3P7N318_CYLGO|nr:unnamed protein product [Cylicostephanus goldi]
MFWVEMDHFAKFPLIPQAHLRRRPPPQPPLPLPPLLPLLPLRHLHQVLDQVIEIPPPLSLFV